MKGHGVSELYIKYWCKFARTLLVFVVDLGTFCDTCNKVQEKNEILFFIFD